MKNKLIILSLIILTLSFVGCGKEKVEEVEILRNITYQTVGLSEPTTNKIFSGSVKGATEANISFRVSGNLINKSVGLGASVTVGDLLATLDPKDYQINLAEARATLAEARANVTRTAADFRRYRELFLNDNASKAEFDNAKAAYEASNARLEAVQERLSFSELQLSYTKLTAPYSGVISVEMADESENLSAGTPVFTLVRKEAPEVQIFLPEDFTSKVKVGELVKVTIAAVSNDKYTGVIKEIGGGVTGFGNTFPAKVSILDAGTDIKTGMTAQVSLDLFNPNAGRMLVPLNSISEGGDGSNFLYVLNAAKEGQATLVKHNIKLGALIGREIEVLSGLEPGSKVVTAGVNYVYDGQRVKFSAQN